MTNSETSSSDPNLTGTDGTQESKVESTEPEGKDEAPAKNFQHSLQIKQERIKELEAKLKEKEEAEKQKKLSEMSEAERIKSLLEEESAKRGKLELQLIVKEALTGRSIPRAIEDLLVKSPWAIPAVQDELGDTFTWDDAIDSVKRNLPSYIDSLVVKNESQPLEIEEPSTKKVDSERSVDSSVVREHIYTREEVEKITKDPVEYEKHRDRILKQISKSGGKLP